jgi:MraZ protein
MFRGRFEYTIDSKGRVSIPAKFRELLAEKYDDRLILTNFDRCLVAYPYEEWRVLEDKVSSLSMVKKEAKAFQRFSFRRTECPMTSRKNPDPAHVAGYAQLENVCFAGLVKKFEIWSRERWAEEIGRSRKILKASAKPCRSGL